LEPREMRNVNEQRIRRSVSVDKSGSSNANAERLRSLSEAEGMMTTVQDDQSPPIAPHSEIQTTHTIQITETIDCTTILMTIFVRISRVALPTIACCSSSVFSASAPGSPPAPAPAHTYLDKRI
jgi:hypothetical protein